jgi:hypothetical protein
VQQVTFQQLIEQGRVSASLGESWHFHVIKDACELLERDCEVLFVLEYGDRIIKAQGSVTDIAAIAELSKLLHRETSVFTESQLTPDLQLILNRAQQFVDDGVPWHHHVLFPHCMLNKNAGSWNVLLEGSGNVLSATASEEPSLLLSQLEPLFYSQSQR